MNLQYYHIGIDKQIIEMNDEVNLAKEGKDLNNIYCQQF